MSKEDVACVVLSASVSVVVGHACQGTWLKISVMRMLLFGVCCLVIVVDSVLGLYDCLCAFGVFVSTF